MSKTSLRLIAVAMTIGVMSGQAVAQQRSAIIIGISQYEDGDIGDLQYADSDAKALAATLSAWGGYDRRCIIELYNSQATGNRITRAFTELNEKCPGTDGSLGSVLFFYSGHGVEASVSEQADFRKVGLQAREFLAPHDARKNRTFSVGGSQLNSTFITKEELASDIKKLKAQEVTIILDSCHSGMDDFSPLILNYLGYRVQDELQGFDGGAKKIRIIEAGGGRGNGPAKTYALLSASTERKIAREWPDLQHGALSYAVLQSLNTLRNNGTSDRPQIMTIDALQAEVKGIFDQVRVNNRTLSSYHKPQYSPAPTELGGRNVVAEVTGIGPLAAQSGQLRIQGAAAGSSLYIDGSTQARRADQPMSLSAGQHVVTVRSQASSYQHVMPVTITANQTRTEQVQLYGMLNVVAQYKDRPSAPPPNLTVYLDNELLGEGPNIGTRKPGGTYHLRVTFRDEFNKVYERTKEVSIRPDSPLTVRYTIEKQAGGPSQEEIQRKRKLDIPF